MNPGKSYYRVMLGEKSMYAEECFAGSFIGTDFDIKQDLSNDLPDDWRKFNQKFIPIYLPSIPRKTRSVLGWRAARCGLSPRASRRATWCSALTGPANTVREKSSVHTATNRARFFFTAVRCSG